MSALGHIGHPDTCDPGFQGLEGVWCPQPHLLLIVVMAHVLPSCHSIKYKSPNTIVVTGEYH